MTDNTTYPYIWECGHLKIAGEPIRHTTRAIEVLSRVPQDTQSVIGAEIGVFAGVMSSELLRLQPNLFLFMVDSWRKDAAGQKYFAEKKTVFAEDRRFIIHKDSVSASAEVDDDLLDFCFIDGDHSYKDVKADIMAWVPKVKSGGWLCGHDYNKPNGTCQGVDEAVQEFLEEHPDLTLEEGLDMTWFIRLA